MKNNFAGIVNLSRLHPKKFCAERTISLWIHLQFVGAMDVQLKCDNDKRHAKNNLLIGLLIFKCLSAQNVSCKAHLYTK